MPDEIVSGGDLASDNSRTAELLRATSGCLKATARIRADDMKRQYAQRLGLKLLLHANSAYYLSRGTAMLNYRDYSSFGVAPDPSSLSTVVRAALETLLTINHVFLGPKGSQSEFRFSAWVLGSRRLIDRLPSWAAATQYTLDRESLGNREDELQEIEAKLRASEEFKRLSAGQQGKVLKGDWRIGASWASLVTGLGIGTTEGAMIYSFLSSPVHFRFLQYGRNPKGGCRVRRQGARFVLCSLSRAHPYALPPSFGPAIRGGCALCRPASTGALGKWRPGEGNMSQSQRRLRRYLVVAQDVGQEATPTTGSGCNRRTSGSRTEHPQADDSEHYEPIVEGWSWRTGIRAS